MDGDKFISTNKNTNISVDEETNNFFIQSENLPIFVPQTEPLKHINDYDSNILKEEAYRDVPDEIFKLEYKMSKIEKDLIEIERQIQMASEINDYVALNNLNSQKEQLELDLKDLTIIYKEASISAKISGGVTSNFKEKLGIAGKFMKMLCELVLSKIPGKISSIIEMRNSLAKLENINKNVDELMKVQYPYGEAAGKYEQLSKYIARANTIQAEISKFIH